MRPLVLHGHGRPLTRVVINRDGDLLFTSAKEKAACVWFLENGERLGTYGYRSEWNAKKVEESGHDGAINDCDVSPNSNYFVTGSGDDSIKIWDVEKGAVISTHTGASIVRTVRYSYSGNLIAYGTQGQKKATGATASYVAVIDSRDPTQFCRIEGGPSATSVRHDLDNISQSVIFSHLDDVVTVAGDRGMLEMYELSNFTAPVVWSELHTVESKSNNSIRDIKLSPDRHCLITACQDKTARLFDARTLESLDKTYQSQRSINSAAISPNRPHVVCGGGQDALSVTTTAAAEGHFEAKFYHLVYCDEFVKIGGHFGPINSVCYSPDGETVVTGGEDGYVRVHRLDTEFKNFEILDE